MVFPQPHSDYFSTSPIYLCTLRSNITVVLLIESSLVFAISHPCLTSPAGRSGHVLKVFALRTFKTHSRSCSWTPRRFDATFSCDASITARWRVKLYGLFTRMGTQMSDVVLRAFLARKELFHVPLFTLRFLFWEFVYPATELSLSIWSRKDHLNVIFLTNIAKSRPTFQYQLKTTSLNIL